MNTDLKISSLQDLVGLRPVQKAETEKKGPSLDRMNISKDAQGSSDSTRVSLGETRASAEAYGYAQSLGRTIKEATKSIKDIREKQEGLAKESAKIADSRRQSSMNNEVAALENEVNRIASQATVNGQNVLKEGGTITLPQQNFVVSFGSNSGITNALELNISNQEQAEAAKETLESGLAAARLANLSAQSSQAKLESGPTTPPSQNLTAEKEDSEASENEAVPVATEVAPQLAGADPKLQSAQQIIGSTLEPGDEAAEEEKKKKLEEEE